MIRHGLTGTGPHCLHRAAKYRARCKNIPFNLTIYDIPPIPDRCPILGIPLFRNPSRGPTDNSPSLDRINPELGYVVGNVRVISYRANRLRSDATFDELFRIASYAHSIERAA